MRIKTALPVLATLALAGCGGKGALIDFGPEPGTPGDPAHWHYQPELHGPNAPPREETMPKRRSSAADVAAPAASAAEPAASTAMPALPPVPPPPAVPASPVSEAMFNDAIRRAVAAGEIDRALRLLEEAERLGSGTARQTFIDAIEAR